MKTENCDDAYFAITDNTEAWGPNWYKDVILPV